MHIMETYIQRNILTYMKTYRNACNDKHRDILMEVHKNLIYLRMQPYMSNIEAS